MQTKFTETYPPEQPTRCVIPAELRITRILWFPGGGIITGTVGDVEFCLDLPTAVILDRRKLVQNVWRFRQLLGIVPTIEAWNSMLATAEEAGRA
ncbi:MAG: hypothetical protein SGJ19_05010 [Planctomycetia bacterium]|nr:hypothetical protein [Planctomycetia bacterium]